VLTRPEYRVGPDRNTGRSRELLRELLVHRGRRGEHIGPDVRDARHLEQTLDRAVLAVGAVKSGKDHIDIAERSNALGGVEHHEPARGRVAR
jgi:hypothetical protein